MQDNLWNPLLAGVTIIALVALASILFGRMYGVSPL